MKHIIQLTKEEARIAAENQYKDMYSDSVVVEIVRSEGEPANPLSPEQIIELIKETRSVYCATGDKIKTIKYVLEKCRENGFGLANSKYFVEAICC